MRVAVDEDGVVVGGRGGDEGVDGRDSAGSVFSQGSCSQGNGLISRDNACKEVTILIDDFFKTLVDVKLLHPPMNLQQAQRGNGDSDLGVQQE